jgi:hypothetical protein
VRPAEGEHHIAFARERAIAGIAVDLKDALKPGKMRDWPRGGAVRRVDIGYPSAEGRLARKAGEGRWCDVGTAIVST